jgi:ATP-binding cassette subfamily F protein uup
MILISASGLSKAFTQTSLFQNISFGIEQGEKVGLIGKNGAGKTTLLRILAGVETPDSGEIIRTNNIKVDYLTQTTEYDYDDTAIDYVMNGIPELHEAFQEYHFLLDSQSPEPDKLAELSHRIEELNGWSIESEAKKILQKVGITDFDKSLHTASGGEKKRIALAKILIAKPDLLILDEPTNHLDADTVQWLQDELSATNLTIIFVTHDRYFLDALATRIVELDFEKLLFFDGNYETYLIQKQALLLNEKSTNEHLQNKLRQELAWLSRGAKARRTKQKARIDWAGKMKDDIRFVDHKRIKIEVGKNNLGSKVIEANNVGFTIGDRLLVANFNYNAQHGDRIGVIGPNGSGKTTLLKIFAGMQSPTKGTCKLGSTVKIGYFEQEHKTLDESNTVIGSLQEIAEYINVGVGKERKITCRELLDRFLFPRNRHNTFVHTLSGGEKKRLALLRLLMANPNVLLLDEPTNDFDIETLNVFENYLDDFLGVLIIVSHDRSFLDRCAEFIWAFEGKGVIKEYPGNYTAYLEKKEAKKSELREQKSNEKKTELKIKDDNKSTPKSNKLTYKEKLELEKIEIEISALESRKSELESQLGNPGQDYKVLEQLSHELNEADSRLDKISNRWLELSEKE